MRKILETLRHKWAEYLLEILVITIGILGAFMLNNWNQTMLERNEEIQILESMRADFIETKNRVDKTIELQTRVVDYCNKLIYLMYEKDAQMSNDSIREYTLFGALAYWRIEPVTGTYDALIGSGKTAILRNQNLNRSLAEFSAEIKYGFEDEDYGLDLTTLLTEKSSSYVQFFILEKDKEMFGLKSDISENEKENAIKKHLKNSSFLGILLSKFYMAKNRLEYQKNILKHVEKILIVIESELEMKAEK